MNDYSEKLKDPRWQRVRLEKMKAADWKCELCCDSKEELNVHHLQYFQGAEPWDYNPGYLICVCRTCHTLLHLNFGKVKHFSEVGPAIDPTTGQRCEWLEIQRRERD